MTMQAAQTQDGHPLARGVHQTRIILEMIKFEHTVFMLPFALMATVLAAQRPLAPLLAQAAVDRAGHGRRAFVRDGLQPSWWMPGTTRSTRARPSRAHPRRVC